MKKHKETQGTYDKTIPNFFLEYINKYENEDKEKVLALGVAYSSFCHLASKTLDDQVEDLQNEVKKPDIFAKRWGPNLFIAAPGNLEFGKVYPAPPNVSYQKDFFQTMKNYKLSQWVLTAGETHVSLGCVDFAQLIFGIFDGDLTQPIHFLGVDSAMVSIVRCKVLYQMILNQVMSRSILQVWFSSGWSTSTLKDFIDACNQLMKSKELLENESNLVQYWLSNDVSLKKATDEWFKASSIKRGVSDRHLKCRKEN